jgi:hypothetical protein
MPFKKEQPKALLAMHMLSMPQCVQDSAPHIIAALFDKISTIFGMIRSMYTAMETTNAVNPQASCRAP